MNTPADAIAQVQQMCSGLLSKIDTMHGNDIKNILVKLASLVGTVKTERARREHIYYVVWCAIKRKHELTDKTADMEAKSGEQYKEVLEVQYAEDSAIECINALKKALDWLIAEKYAEGGQGK